MQLSILVFIWRESTTRNPHKSFKKWIASLVVASLESIRSLSNIFFPQFINVQETLLHIYLHFSQI